MNLTNHASTYALGLGLVAALAGCQDFGIGAPDTNVGALQLTTDILDDTDVAGFSYTVTEVDCGTGLPIEPPNVFTAYEDLADALIPGGDSGLVGAPYDANSTHLFADHFFWLEEGCYDVEVVPMNADGKPSEDCYAAHADAVPVFDGQVSEILLISQCEGDPFGGLDIIATLNHPPQIDDLTYDPSKFVCVGEEVEICIDVSDPDLDPTTIVWRPATANGAAPTNVTETLNDDGTTTFCATFTFDAPGTYEVSATVYDMAWDADGNPITIEELLAIQGDNHPSHDDIVFPIHVLDEDACFDSCDCPEGYEATPGGEECIRTTTTEPTQASTTYEVCKARTNPNYSRDGAMYPGGTVVTSPFWGLYYNDLNSRLNTIGVWACDTTIIDTNETFATNTPTGEWIGFSVCLDVEEAGDYIVGLGADNQMRFSLNGTLIENWNTNATQNFTWWHNSVLPLNSGLNIVTLEGYNQSSAAAYGAEIAGPFPAGSLNSDAAMIAADYENNRIFSTLDVIGEPFDIGEFSGYSCEDGWVLNTCTDAPTCTLIERVPCIED